MHDYEADPRPLAECLKEWQVALNGGRIWGAPARAAAELRAELPTYKGWIIGRSPSESHERLIRRMMTIQAHNG